MSIYDAQLRSILTETKTIAIVGVSPNTIRPSWFVGNYLNLKGYRIIPVNPGHAGKKLFGATIVSDLSEIAEPVDMVDIFRRSDQVLGVVEAAIAHLSGLKTVWMQIGVINEQAAEVAQAQGLQVVMNKCPKIEYQRLMGELRQGGIATGIISSKLDPL